MQTIDYILNYTVMCSGLSWTGDQSAYKGAGVIDLKWH